MQFKSGKGAPLPAQAFQTETKAWTTPQAHDVGLPDPTRWGRHGTLHGGRDLNDEAAMVEASSRTTPCADDTGLRTKPYAQGGSALSLQAKGAEESAWPTPTSRDWKSGSASAETLERNARPLSEVMRTQQPGPLNPAWVEALMGFPQGWTEPPDVPPTKRSRLTKTLEEIFATPSPIDGPPVAANLSTPGKPRARRTRSPHASRG
jgi:hypothetical protein